MPCGACSSQREVVSQVTFEPETRRQLEGSIYWFIDNIRCKDGPRDSKKSTVTSLLAQPILQNDPGKIVLVNHIINEPTVGCSYPKAKITFRCINWALEGHCSFLLTSALVRPCLGSSLGAQQFQKENNQLEQVVRKPRW